MEDILKIVTSLEDSGILLKGVSEAIKDKAKEQRGGFLSILLGTLGSILLGNILAGKGVIELKKELLELAKNLENLQSRNLYLKNFDSAPCVNKF